MKRTYIAVIAMCIFPVLYHLRFWYEILKCQRISNEFGKSWTFTLLYSFTPTITIFHVLPLIPFIAVNFKIWTTIGQCNRTGIALHVHRGIDMKKIIFTIVVFSLLSNLLPVFRKMFCYIQWHS